MRVKAIEMGFYGGVRKRPGAVFEVPDGVTGKWFVPIAQPPKPEPKPEPEPKPKRGAKNTLKELGEELTHASDIFVRE